MEDRSVSGKVGTEKDFAEELVSKLMSNSSYTCPLVAEPKHLVEALKKEGADEKTIVKVLSNANLDGRMNYNSHIMVGERKSIEGGIVYSFCPSLEYVVSFMNTFVIRTPDYIKDIVSESLD